MTRYHRVPLAVLLLTICLVYANSFSNAFHFDDFHTIVDNPAVRSLGNLHRIFTDTTAFSVLPANQTYRPMVTASLALDYALGHGYTLFWFHLSTVLWFLVLVALLTALAELLFQCTEPDETNFWLALGVGAWFGLHPAMAETVNYIIQRGDLYCTLGCVAALYIFSRWPAQRRYGWYLLPFVVALLSKPPAAIFPLLLLSYVVLFENTGKNHSRRWARAGIASIPSVVVAAAGLWLQSAMTPKSFAPSILSPSAYRLTQPFVWLRYVGELFLPLHLNVDTDLQAFRGMNAAELTGLAFLVVLGSFIALTARYRRAAPVTFGLLWFVLTQLPTSIYPLSEVENDHRMFFSFPGLMLAAVWAMHLAYREWTARWPSVQHWASRVAMTAALLCLAGYAYGAHRRNNVWHSEATLWADDVVKSPHNGRGLMIYGLTRMNIGQYAAARDLFEQALRYTPNYPTLEINLGIVNGLLAAQGHPNLVPVAEQHFKRAIELAPEDDTTHAFYGRWLLGQGRLAEACDQLRVAVRLNPLRPMQRDLLMQAYQSAGNLVAARQLAAETLTMNPTDAEAAKLTHGSESSGDWINSSLADYRAGRFEQSLSEAQQALRLDPNSGEAWNNIGADYGALHQWPAAIAAEKKAVALEPGLQIAQNNLRWFTDEEGRAASGEPRTVADWVNRSLELNAQGRYLESITAAQAALRLDPRSAEAWNNIAAGREALHQWGPAVEAAQNALRIRPDFQLAKNNLAWSLQQQRIAVTH